jgi:hypothetical protein
MNINFMLKVEDAKMADIKKALETAGIKVRSIQEIYKDGVGGDKEEKAG